MGANTKTTPELVRCLVDPTLDWPMRPDMGNSSLSLYIIVGISDLFSSSCPENYSTLVTPNGCILLSIHASNASSSADWNLILGPVRLCGSFSCGTDFVFYNVSFNNVSALLLSFVHTCSQPTGFVCKPST